MPLPSGNSPNTIGQGTCPQIPLPFRQPHNINIINCCARDHPAPSPRPHALEQRTRTSCELMLPTYVSQYTPRSPSTQKEPMLQGVSLHVL